MESNSTTARTGGLSAREGGPSATERAAEDEDGTKHTNYDARMGLFHGTQAISDYIQLFPEDNDNDSDSDGGGTSGDVQRVYLTADFLKAVSHWSSSPAPVRPQPSFAYETRSSDEDNISENGVNDADRRESRFIVHAKGCGDGHAAHSDFEDGTNLSLSLAGDAGLLNSACCSDGLSFFTHTALRSLARGWWRSGDNDDDTSNGATIPPTTTTTASASNFLQSVDDSVHGSGHNL